MKIFVTPRGSAKMAAIIRIDLSCDRASGAIYF